MKSSFYYTLYLCDADNCKAEIDVSSRKSFEDCERILVTETRWSAGGNKHFCPTHKYKLNPKVKNDIKSS